MTFIKQRGVACLDPVVRATRATSAIHRLIFAPDTRMSLRSRATPLSHMASFHNLMSLNGPSSVARRCDKCTCGFRLSNNCWSSLPDSPFVIPRGSATDPSLIVLGQTLPPNRPIWTERGSDHPSERRWDHYKAGNHSHVMGRRQHTVYLVGSPCLNNWQPMSSADLHSIHLRRSVQ